MDLAERSNVCVLGIHHVTKWTSGKTPSERYTGSLAFGAVARIGLMTAHTEREKEEDIGPERILTRAMSNIGPDGGGFAYELELGPLYEYPDIEATRIIWGEEQLGYASDIIARVEGGADDGRSRTSKKVEEWLAQYLADGARPQREVEEVGARFHFSKYQIRGRSGS